jgi:plasmid stabilization system protein ParE
MAYKLVWSAEAEADFKNIVEYLKETWSVRTAERFVDNTCKKLESLTAMPTKARPTSIKSIHLYKLDRKHALFFSFEEDYLILLSIYPYKKDITKSKYY